MTSDAEAESPATLNVSEVDVPDRNEAVERLRNQGYTTNSAFGFRSIVRKSDSVVGEMISNSHTQINRFDPETGETKQESIVSTDETKFRIDLVSESLEVYAGKERNGEVINRLGQTIPGLTVTSLNLDLAYLREIISNTEYQTEITAVRVNNISPEPNTNGSCYLNTFTEEAARNLVENYQEDITYICSEIEFSEDDEVTVGFYRSGSIRVFSNSRNDSELLQFIRNVLSEVMSGV